MDSRLEQFERPSMDRRMISEILRSKNMSAEQGSNWLSEWGGPGGYEAWSRQPKTERLVYFAYKLGYSNVEDIAAATDLSRAVVNYELSKLETAGLVEPGVVLK